MLEQDSSEIRLPFNQLEKAPDRGYFCKSTSPDCGLSRPPWPVTEMEQKKDPIRIKKYSNRRLYDITHSRHLTLEELVELIKAGHEVQVIDSKSKEDITQSVLMQMLMEDKGAHLFSAPFLHQLIRNREGILGEFFTDFVPKMLDAYLETQDSVRQQMENFSVPTNWMNPTGEMKMPIFDPFGAFKKKTGETSESSDPVNKNRDEVDELRMKLRELEERLNSIKS